ncbi:hypothetical protein [Paenibacillus polymyxa]|uniref:hypothetical protein n=1 Tax=Paenibacillus polymyxa TaxID=1406 RepID=UPI0023792975|nr:hypothetical protein [Paenibacillus polymyxa]WDM22315.1 hypothetical protein J4I02_01175 [Paenibacillus polymyxa]
MASDTVEYAKVVRIPVKSSVQGFSTDVTLPSSFSINDGGFINFYVGFGDYECGISTASGQSAWRWFANSGKVSGTDAGGSFGEFSNSQKVNIRLELVLESGKTYKVKFYVNNTHWHTFSPAYTATSSFSDGRVVLGAAQQTYPINGVPATLPAWKIFHTQVMTSNTKYKTTNGTWVNVNSSNSSPATDHTPKKPNTPNPVDYTVGSNSFGSGIYYASLK